MQPVTDSIASAQTTYDLFNILRWAKAVGDAPTCECGKPNLCLSDGSQFEFRPFGEFHRFSARCRECDALVAEVEEALAALRLKHARQQARANQEHLESEVGHHHAHCSIQNFQTANDSQRAALQVISGDWWLANRFLILVGSPGVGKTHLAVAAMREVQRARYIPVFNSETRLLHDWRRAAQQRIAFDGLDRLMNAAVTVLDDVGSAKPTDGSLELIHTLLDSRYRDSAPTILTTNLSLEELERRWGEKHVSRMVERGFGRAVHVEGSNYRLRPE